MSNRANSLSRRFKLVIENTGARLIDAMGNRVVWSTLCADACAREIVAHVMSETTGMVRDWAEVVYLNQLYAKGSVYVVDSRLPPPIRVSVDRHGCVCAGKRQR